MAVAGNGVGLLIKTDIYLFLQGERKNEEKKREEQV